VPSPSAPNPPSLTSLLSALTAAGIEFVLVGGLAAVAQGAPLATLDVDIVPRRDPENVDRLFALLGTLHARYRGRQSTPVPLSRGALGGPGHSLLVTDLGPLDCSEPSRVEGTTRRCKPTPSTSRSRGAA